jgi:copper-binding protein NosD
MRNRKTLAAAVVAAAVLAVAGTASAADIRGTISSTLVITEDSQLVGDVTCTVAGAPCIAFGASGIALKLNGFRLTGQANPVTACSGSNNTTLESGIDVSNQRGAVIQGPGVVQNFRSSGIRVNMSTRVMVALVTASTNCMAGIWVIGGSDHEIVNNTFSRNGNVTLPCGGI